MQVIVSMTETRPPSAGETGVLHCTGTAQNRWVYNQPVRQTYKLDYVLVLLTARHVTTKLGKAVTWRRQQSAWRRASRALGLNHSLHSDKKAHSTATSCLCLLLPLFTNMGLHSDRYMWRQCSDDFIRRKGIKDEAHIRSGRRSPCSGLEGSASWSSLCDD